MTQQRRLEIEQWLAIDPDPKTADELRRLVENDPAAASALFSGRIAFGTAGLRAAMGPGPLQMNRLVVRQTTIGLMRWLPSGAKVVVGFDARHQSAAFATEVTEVVAAAGGRAEVLPEPLPTPVLAHAVLERGADAGVMITASHNPASDNGYKLYLADGIQLVDPADAEIAARIDEVVARSTEGPSVAALTVGPGESPLTPGTVTVLDESVAQRHVQAAVAACRTDKRAVRVLYTAMHGVGGRHLLAAFAAGGFPEPLVVKKQFGPDPDFPTVGFPNPEEPGALDLAFAAAAAAAAASASVDVILANDPDADRLAVAVPDRTGRWQRLSGDQVGVLLADHLLQNGHGDRRLVASSLVSSRLISAMAAEAKVTSVRTLTGFKWVARPIVENPDVDYVFGYEEALGYCVGDRVRDKDGISAALVMAELVASAIADGETLWDRLDRLAERHGVYLTGPVTMLFDGADGLARREQVMIDVTASPPRRLAGVEIVEQEDLSLGRSLPPTTGLVWHLSDRSRVIIRPSGTEPKLKAYVEVIEPTEESTVAVATAQAKKKLAVLQDDVARLLDS